MRAERIVLLGAPAAGKGTQVERLRDRFGFSVASTGQMLRDEEKLGTEIGLLSKELSKSGTLVPDPIVLNLIEAWLGECSSRVLFDGFPRTVPQARAFGELLERSMQKIDLVLHLATPESVSRQRAAKRLTCQQCGLGVPVLGGDPAPEICERCGGALLRRRDDASAAFDLRMGEYRSKTVPVINYYRDLGLLRTVDGSGTPDGVFDLIVDLVE